MFRLIAKTDGMRRFLDGVVRDQIPFALSLGLNLIGKDFVTEERAGIELRFTIRRPAYILPSVRMDRGTKARPDVRTYIDPERNILAKFELGGYKLPTAYGSRVVAGSIAIPVFGNATDQNGVIRPGLLPSNLGLASSKRLGKFGATEVTRAGLKGARRTFVILPGTSPGLPDGGIFQRTGPGKRDIRALFLLKPRVPIPPLLEFEKTGQQVASDRWAPDMEIAWARAIATSREAMSG